MEQKYGIIAYKNSINLGDQIQSIAAKQLFDKNNVETIDYFVDRDKNIIYNINNNIQNDLPLNSLYCIYNGWFDKNYASFPLNPSINPLFISFHVNETQKDSTYNWLQTHETNSLKSLCHIDNKKEYDKCNYGIGCRDVHTLNKFIENKYTNAYLSGCLTMTLEINSVFSQKREHIYIVDVNISDIRAYVPKKILDNSIVLSHVYKKDMLDEQQKLKEAEQLLKLYQNAKLVITSRLHCALPCLAYSTPVVFSYYNMNDVRLKGLIDTIPVIGKQSIDWDNVKNTLPDNWNSNVMKMRNIVSEWVEKSKNDY